ncbi:SMODS domain-containing nucleotidyltransferase [Nocardioides sp. URHA0032]|uniref:SMODS domain-containing nucleotidyltransferase n=1 Tax=Nocardioides sp. URHA0032 TaxID=1380388 RepID=UPI000687B407|nr:nucleotidyltransferase [Nocardioides sp. URHA0032]
MTQTSDFRNFLTNKVNLNQTRINTLSAKVASLQTFLTNDEVFGDHVSELLPQGSFAHGTIIKPVGTRDFDADVLMPMDDVPGWSAADYVENLYTAFGRSNSYKTMRGRHSRCVRIDYSGDFHVDVVPFVTRNGATYITNRVKNEFQVSAPDEFTAWLEGQNRITDGNLVKVVRLLKYLRDHKSTYKVPSVTLTAALAHQVSDTATVLDPDAYKNVANTLRTLSSALSAQVDGYETVPPYIKDPGTGQDLTDRWKPENYIAFRDRFRRHATLIANACDAQTYAEALAIWRDLFGPDFGESVTLTAAVEAHYAAAPPATEKFLDKNFGIEERINPAYTVKAVGEVVPKKGFRNRPLPATGDLVDKYRDIIVRIKDCNVPEPYDLYWKVRNHGEEAEQASALRGDIHKDDGSKSRKESTQYVGRHYVEAYIVKDGVCVAKSRQPVIVTSRSGS